MVWIGGVVVMLGLVLGGWFLAQREQTPEGGNAEKLSIAATFFPLADFARAVGGAQVEVTQITPDGAEVHEYEPSPQDITELLSADVVLINGGGLEPWAEKLTADIQSAGRVVVRMSDVVPFLSLENEQDPHAWLDPARAQTMVRAIAKAFGEKDSGHAAAYSASAEAFISKLITLDDAFSNTLRTCETKNVLVAHDAFQAWELRYNITIHAVAGISPEAEPSLERMVELVQEAKELGVTTVFFESPASTALAETIAKEIGASVGVLSTLEGRTSEEITKGEGYIAIMQKNLDALARALSCQRP